MGASGPLIGLPLSDVAWGAVGALHNETDECINKIALCVEVMNVYKIHFHSYNPVSWLVLVSSGD